MTIYLGEIRLFAGNFAPEGWALCDGAELQVEEHPSLFALLGATYGGDGVKTFGLPNLIDRIPVHGGAGPGLAPTPFGQAGGTPEARIPAASWPPHTHAFVASQAAATAQTPSNGLFAATTSGYVYYGPAPSAGATGLTLQTMNGGAIEASGDGAPVPLGMPDLGLSYIICLGGGEFPVKEGDR